MYINMPKQKTLFSIKTKISQTNMNVSEHLYNHFQSLPSAQQKEIRYLMLLKYYKILNHKNVISFSDLITSVNINSVQSIHVSTGPFKTTFT